MSKIAINFEAVISKKLEALCEQGEEISISLGPLNGNKAIGVIHLITKEGVMPSELTKIGETSLIIRIGKSYQESPDYPKHEGPGISSMFEASDKEEIPSNVEKIVGRTNPNSKDGDPHYLTKIMEDKDSPSKEEIAEAITLLRTKRAQEEQEAIAYLRSTKTPKSPEVAKPNIPQKPSQPSINSQANLKPPKTTTAPSPKPSVFNSIMSYEDMVSSAEKVQGVEKPLPNVGDKKLTREQAIKVEESIPRLSKRAYVKNMLKSELMIDDLVISGQGVNARCFGIKGNGVCDLSRLPARSLLESGQLRWCFSKNYLAFVDYDTYLKQSSKLEELPHSSLPVFDSIEEAESGTGMAAGETSTTRTIRTASVDDSGEPIPGSLAMECLEDGSAPESQYEDSSEMDSLLRSMPREKNASQSSPSIKRTR